MSHREASILDCVHSGHFEVIEDDSNLSVFSPILLHLVDSGHASEHMGISEQQRLDIHRLLDQCPNTRVLLSYASVDLAAAREEALQLAKVQGKTESLEGKDGAGRSQAPDTGTASAEPGSSSTPSLSLLAQFEQGSPTDRVRVFWQAYEACSEEEKERHSHSKPASARDHARGPRRRATATSNSSSGGGGGGHVNTGRDGTISTAQMFFAHDLVVDDVAMIACLALLRQMDNVLSPALMGKILARSPLGGAAIISLVCNCTPLLSPLLSGYISGDPHEDTLSHVVLKLAKMSPTLPRRIRAVLVDAQTRPALIIQLTEMTQQSSTLFLSSLLHPHCAWFWDGLRSGAHSQHAPSLNRLLQTQHEAVIAVTVKIARQEVTQRELTQAVTVFRLYCAFAGIADVKLSQPEIVACLTLLCQVTDERLLECGLAFVLLCRDLVLFCPPELIRQFLSHMENTVARHTLLLVAVRLHVNRLTLIHDSVASMSRLKGFTLNQRSLAKLREVVLEAFPELLLTSMIITSPPTLNLSAHSPPSIIDSVYPLLRERVAVRHRVDAGDWLLAQICELSRPMHRLVAAVLHSYVDCTIPMGATYESRAAAFVMKPLAEAQVLEVLDAGEVDGYGPPQVAMMFYLLQQLRRDPECVTYSPDLITRIPVHKVLACVEKDREGYAHIMPPLYELLVSEVPSLFTVTPFLEAEDRRSAPRVSLYVGSLNDLPELTSEFIHTNFCAPLQGDSARAAVTVLQRLCALPSKRLLQFEADLFQVILTRARRSFTTISPCVQRWVLELWIEYSRLTTPATVIPGTVNALRMLDSDNLMMTKAQGGNGCGNGYDDGDGSTGAQEGDGEANRPQLSYAEIRDDTLQIVRLVSDLAPCPPLAQIALRCLDMILPDTHRAIMRSQSQFGADQFLAVLESAVVQALLDVLCQRCLEPCDLQTSLTGHLDDDTVLPPYGQTAIEGRETVSAMSREQPKRNQIRTATAMGDGDVTMIDGVPVTPATRLRFRHGTLEPTARLEISDMVCAFIHDRFVHNGTTLIKLVHFQGYPPPLLAITVGQIPSMHVCIPFVSELLSQFRSECKIFGMYLGGALIEKYPLPISVELAHLLIAYARGVVETESRDVRLRLASVRALSHIVKAIPSLADPVLDLLYTYYDVGMSHTVHGGESALCRAVEGAYSWIVRRVIVKEDTTAKWNALGIRV